MSNYKTARVLELGKLLKGTCTNPDHKWTTVHGFGSPLRFEICLIDNKVKEGNMKQQLRLRKGIKS
jgi:hypothetical protein